MVSRRIACASLLASIAAACGDSAPVELGASALAVIDYADGSRVTVSSLGPDPVRPGETVTVSLHIDSSGPLDLEAVLWPVRIGGRELVLGSGVTSADAARPDDVRVQRIAQSGVQGEVAIELLVPRPWHGTTAMITVSQPQVPAVAGPRTRDGLGTAGLVNVTAVPTQISARRVNTPLVIDGRLDERAWNETPGVPLVESLGGEPSPLSSQVWMLWDDQALYVGAVLDDDDIWSRYTAHDDPLWKEEAFELFLFGDATRRDYLELQVSPQGVTFDAKFTQYRRGDTDWNSRWQTAVRVDGTVNARSDHDSRWVVEVAVPFAEICESTAMVCPPLGGSTTRINVFRLDRPAKGGTLAQALSPPRVPDFHAPENAAVLELEP